MTLKAFFSVICYKTNTCFLTTKCKLLLKLALVFYFDLCIGSFLSHISIVESHFLHRISIFVDTSSVMMMCQTIMMCLCESVTMLEIEGNVIIERGMKCSLFTDIHVILSKDDLKLFTKRHCKLTRLSINNENEAKGKWKQNGVGGEISTENVYILISSTCLIGELHHRWSQWWD